MYSPIQNSKGTLQLVFSFLWFKANVIIYPIAKIADYRFARQQSKLQNKQMMGTLDENDPTGLEGLNLCPLNSHFLPQNQIKKLLLSPRLGIWRRSKS